MNFFCAKVGYKISHNGKRLCEGGAKKAETFY